MSIEHCDNWSIYGGNVSLLTNGVYAGIGSGGTFQADPDGGGNLVWAPATNFFQNLSYVLAAAENIVGCAERIWYSSLPGDVDHYAEIITWNDNTNTPIAWVGVNPTGSLTLYTNYGTYTTAGPVITANGWWHIEAKMNVSAGTFEIRVEGTTVLSETGINLGMLPAAIWAWTFKTVFTSGSPQIYYKDLVLWNGSGTQNTDFLGSVIVETLLPTADVSLNWTPTPNTDTGATILATTPPADSTIYLDAPNPPPAAYEGTFAHLSGDITSVKCLMTMVRAAKVDGGDGSLQVGLISSPASAPATALGANRPITTAQTYWRDVIELDPKTAAAWLPAAVNLAEIQINRTT